MADVRSAAVGPELVPRIWTDGAHGLEKLKIDFRFETMEKANEFSTVELSIEDEVDGLSADLESNLLRLDSKRSIVHKMGTAETPVDCYIEMLLQNMLIGEKSRCIIKRSAGKEPVRFIMKLRRIDSGGYLHQLSCGQAVDISKQYKEIGVRMFKRYPKFAQIYFCKAVKCLLSFSPIEEIPTEEAKDIDVKEVVELIHNLYINISVGLIKERRFTEVVSVLDFLDKDMDKKNALYEKGVFRKATAFFELKMYAEAKQLIETVDSFRTNAPLNGMYSKTLDKLNEENLQYSDLVKKMFK